MGVLGLSHDAHIGKILKLEDEARNIETKAYQSTVHVSLYLFSKLLAYYFTRSGALDSYLVSSSTILCKVAS